MRRASSQLKVKFRQTDRDNAQVTINGDDLAIFEEVNRTSDPVIHLAQHFKPSIPSFVWILREDD